MENIVIVQDSECDQRVVQASTDEQLIGIWLHGKSPRTITAYRLDIDRFMKFTGKPIKTVTIGDLQDWMDTLPGSSNRRNRAIMAIKSLFGFAQKIGFVQFNVAAVIKGINIKNTLSERIVTEAKIHEIIALETNRRNKLILRTLYYSGVRVSELVGLEWKDLRDRTLTAFGKGGKTRHIRLPDGLSDDLESQRQPNGPLFISRYGKQMSSVALWKIIKKAGERVGIKAISPHWFRHSHASHSLDRGAAVHLVQATLGHASLTTTTRYAHIRPGESSGCYLA